MDQGDAPRRLLFSWAGLEDQRERVREMAREIVTSDAALRKTMPSSAATGLICAGIRDPSLPLNSDAARASKAQRDLSALHAQLVWEHGLDWDFVRREWAAILDPNPPRFSATTRSSPPWRRRPSGPRRDTFLLCAMRSVVAHIINWKNALSCSQYGVPPCAPCPPGLGAPPKRFSPIIPEPQKLWARCVFGQSEKTVRRIH